MAHYTSELRWADLRGCALRACGYGPAAAANTPAIEFAPLRALLL